MDQTLLELVTIESDLKSRGRMVESEFAWDLQLQIMTRSIPKVWV